MKRVMTGRIVIVAFAVLALAACDAPYVPSAVDESETRSNRLDSNSPLLRRLETLHTQQNGRVVIFDTHNSGTIVYGVRVIQRDRAHLPPGFRAKIWPASAHAPRQLTSMTVTSAAATSDGETSAFTTLDGTLRFQRPESRPAIVARNVHPGFDLAPDGRTLAFVSGPRPEFDLYVIDVGDNQRSSPRRLTHDSAPAYLPRFSSDGARILFVSSRSGLPSLWTIRTDASSLRQVTNRELDAMNDARRALPAPEGVISPVWRGGIVAYWDGRGVRFVSSRTGETLQHLSDSNSVIPGGRDDFIVESSGQPRFRRVPPPQGSR